MNISNYITGYPRRSLLGCNKVRLDTVEWLPWYRSKSRKVGCGSTWINRRETTHGQFKIKRKHEGYCQGRLLRSLPQNRWEYKNKKRVYVGTLVRKFAYTLTVPQNVVQ